MAALAFSFLIAALLEFSLNWLALIPWRRAAGGLPWNERAALLHPARVSSGANVWLLTASMVFACQIALPGSSPLPSGIGGFLGALWGTFPMTRAMHPGLTLRSWLGIVAGPLLLGALGLLILAGFALAMPDHFGRVTWLLLGAFLVIHVCLRMGLAIRIMRWLRILRAPPERLARIVDGASRDLGIPVRATWVLRSITSNAMAFTITRELAFTDRLLEAHPDDEVRAVCVHELGHLTEGRWIGAARLLGGMWVVPVVLFRPITARYGFLDLAALGAVAWAAPMLLRRLFRRMEVRADGIAASKTPDSLTYARALERMYRDNQIPAVLPSGRTRVHPDLYDRMTAAGAKPDYPRPLPPRARSWTTWAAGTAAVVLAWMAFNG